MIRIAGDVLVMIIILGLATPTLADTTRCTTREDPAFKRWVTECTDGARAITRWDAGLQGYRTDITKAPKGDKPPRGWPNLGKAPR